MLQTTAQKIKKIQRLKKAFLISIALVMIPVATMGSNFVLSLDPHRPKPKVHKCPPGKICKKPRQSVFAAHKAFRTLIAPNPFPDWLLDQDDLIDQLFQNFRIYQQYLSENSILLPSDSNTQNYQVPTSPGQAPIIFRISFLRNQLSPTDLTEELIFTVNGQPAGILKVHQVGPDVQPTPSSNFLSFDIPVPGTDTKYELIFSGFQTVIVFERTPHKITGTFDIFGGSIALAQDMDGDQITRSYKTTYSGVGQTGPNLQAIAVKSGDNWRLNYLMDNAATTPNNFMNNFEPWISNLIDVDFADGFLNGDAQGMNWPFTDSGSLSQAGVPGF